MRFAAIRNLVASIAALGVSANKAEKGMAGLNQSLAMQKALMPSALHVFGGSPRRWSAMARYPERMSRVKCKGQRDASLRSRSNRRKAAK